LKKRFAITSPEFEKEIAKSEYQRTKLVIAFLLIGLTVVNINYFLLNKSVAEIYGGTVNYFFVIVWLVCFIVYEFVVLRIIGYHQKKYERITETFRFTHTLIEISVPSLLIFYMVHSSKLLPFIDSPVALVYFLFIILSVLHLDFKLSMFTSVLASVEYAAIIYYGFNVMAHDESKMIPENSFYLRCIILMMSGLAGGFVAEELKKRIQTSFELQRAKNNIELLFGQQVSRTVLMELVEERDITKKQEATVLALDIRNFSVFAEKRDPDEILDFQNKIFSPMLEIINQHQGVVNQIMGDGLMATFGTPVSNPLHADMAFQASLKIKEKVKQLSSSGVIPDTRIGLGLHTGNVITGNIGNEDRKQYSISGSAVIIAFRVEQLNKEFGSDMLITGDVKERIALGKVPLVYHGLKSIKGFEYGVEVYQVDA